MTFLIQETLKVAVPLMIVALAGVFAERSGIINLALEGIMILGAFIGVMALSIAQIDTKTYTVGNADALWNVLILSGVISMFACAVPMFFYTITEKRQREMVAEIEARKKN